jgi:hypothetical protein
LLEIAALCLIGQGVLYVLAGPGREQNLFYQLLKMAASPPQRLARLVTPAAFPPLWIGLVAFSLLASGWLLVTYYKICLTLNQC